MNAPWSSVTVWVVLSLLVQVTLVPTETVSDAGLKEKLTMLTLGALPLAGVAVGVCVEVLLVGVLAAVGVLVGVLAAVGVVVGGLVEVVPPQAARKASRVRMSRQNPAAFKEMILCIRLAFRA